MQSFSTTSAPSHQTAAVPPPPRPTTDMRRRIAWKVLDDLASEWVDDIGLRLSEWLRDGQAAVVKTGPHRTVYHLNLPHGRFYLKQFHVPDWRATLQNIVLPLKAQREWTAIEQIRAAGIATVEPVALGQSRTGPWAVESFLVTRAIRDAEPLHDLVLRAERRPEPQRTRLRQRIARGLGEMIGRLHRAGRIHRDLHAGNVLVRIDDNDTPRLWLIDLHSVAKPRWLASRRFAWNLSLLNHFFIGRATATDRLRFFRAYWHRRCHTGTGSAAGLPPAILENRHRQSLRRIEAVCHRAARHAYRKGDRKWSRGNRRLIIADTPACQCRGIAEIGREELSRLRDDVLHNRLTDGGPAAGLPPAVLNTIVDQPRKAWETGHAFLRRGIHTPRPLWFVEATAGRSASVFVTEDIPGAVRLSALLRETSNPPSPHLLRQVALNWGVQLRRMHEHGFDHRRLTAETVLVSPRDGRIWLTDLEHVVPLRWWQETRIVTALARLEQSLPDGPILRRTHRLRFLLRYLGTRRRSEWKRLWRAVSADRSVPKTSRRG